MGSLFSAVVPLLLSITVLFGYVMEMEAREISPGDYWKSVMHNQPIPRSIAELLLINEEFSSSSNSESRCRFNNVSMIKHVKGLQTPVPVPAPAAVSNESGIISTRRFSRTFDTSPNVIIYHSTVIIN